MSKWWTVKELAAHYGLSERSVYDAIAGGHLIAHRFGRKRGGMRVSDEERLAWENGCRDERRAPATPKPRLAVAPPSLARKHFRLGADTRSRASEPRTALDNDALG